MSSKYLVLVDSSVWIDFFRGSSHSYLDLLLSEDLACTNELILTELLPSLHQQNQREVIDSLLSLPQVELTVDWNIIRKYQVMNLQNGLNKVGIPDLIILQQVIDQKLTLYSLDKHFLIMREYLNFDLI